MFPLALLSGGLLFLLTVRKQIREDDIATPAGEETDTDDSTRQSSRLGCAWLFVAASAAFVCLPIAGNIYDIFKLNRVFATHRYAVLTGTVDHFDPMVIAGHRSETFDVAGVKFAYSDLAITAGYHHSAAMGGPIHGGERVRLAYVCQGGNAPGDRTCYAPLIIRIEVARPN